jgi:hypothetical protein
MFATQSAELPRPTYSALWEYLKQQGKRDCCSKKNAVQT